MSEQRVAMRLKPTARWFALLAILPCLACRSLGGSGAFLIFGGSRTPQEDLVESVRAAEAETSAAQEDFGAALHLFQRLTAPQAVELDELNDHFDDAIRECQRRAENLEECLEDVRAEADSLLQGWTEELQHFSGEAMRKKSEAMMLDTQGHAQRVIAALEGVQARMAPVLLELQDYALFFHHNLNARAISTLEDTYRGFDAEFTALDSDLEQARAEIASFLATFQAPSQAP